MDATNNNTTNRTNNETEKDNNITVPDDVLALASIMQAITLVNDLAKDGACDAISLEASISSIAKYGNDISHIYTQEELAIGLQALKNILSGSHNKELMVYFLGLLKLEKSLSKQKNMLAILSNGIDEIKNSKYFSFTHNNSITKLASLYIATLGQFKYKIIINGKKGNLTNENIANHIRALLLAGIRSVILWKNLGGSIWQLPFNKKNILKYLKTI